MTMAVDQDSPIAVVGGVYRERCLRPSWTEIFGSGGRAASAMSSMGAAIELHSYLDPLASDVLSARAELEDFTIRPTPIERSMTFEYDHGLDTPRIYGSGEACESLSVIADRIVRFGLMEGDAVVHGRQVVYDPQDAFAPKPFGANGSTASQLAIVLNRREAELLTGSTGTSDEQLAQILLQQSAAQVVVLKLGPFGSFVCERSSAHYVPAYQSQRVWKIGSGDNFAAHFAFHWLHEYRQAAESADLASRATAYFCQTRGFATPDALSAFNPGPIGPSVDYRAGRKPRVYLAGPFFTLAQLWLIEQARGNLSGVGLDVFSPYHDVGHGCADDVVLQDLAGIDAADIVFAVADGLDSGTIYEVGYARAKAKPVVVYCENESDESKKMMDGSGCILCDDYVTAIYQTFWTACST